jgi:hypothetical protein
MNSGTMLTDGMFHSWDASNRRDANNSRTTRNVGNNSSRKDVNSSSHGGNSRDFSHRRSSWASIAVRTTMAAGTPTTAETTTTAGTQGKPTAAITSATAV